MPDRSNEPSPHGDPLEDVIDNNLEETGDESQDDNTPAPHDRRARARTSLRTSRISRREDGSRLLAWLPPHLRERKLLDRRSAGLQACLVTAGLRGYFVST